MGAKSISGPGVQVAAAAAALFSNNTHEHRRTYVPQISETSIGLTLDDQIVIQEALFGRTVTPAERLRQHQRALAKAQRELDRERTKLEQSEKKLVMDIKKSAKAGQLVRPWLLYAVPLPLFCFLKQGCCYPCCRTHARSWRRTWSAPAVMSRNSTRCARNCRRSDCASRRCAATSKWPMPCAAPRELVSSASKSNISRAFCPPLADWCCYKKTGDEEHEPRAQPPANPAHHERV